MGFVTVDPDAIQDANNQLQTLEGIIDDCRQRHQRHANDTHQALSDLAHRGISGLEHWQIEHIWQASPLGALGWEFHESLEIVKNVRARSEGIFSQLAQYHSQQLAMRMVELNEPILSHLDGAAGALSDLAGWLTFGNILGLIERPDAIFELLAGTARSLEDEMEQLSSARAILDKLRQRALVLIEELEQPLKSDNVRAAAALGADALTVLGLAKDARDLIKSGKSLSKLLEGSPELKVGPLEIAGGVLGFISDGDYSKRSVAVHAYGFGLQTAASLIPGEKLVDGGIAGVAIGSTIGAYAFTAAGKAEGGRFGQMLTNVGDQWAQTKKDTDAWGSLFTDVGALVLDAHGGALAATAISPGLGPVASQMENMAGSNSANLGSDGARIGHDVVGLLRLPFDAERSVDQSVVASVGAGAHMLANSVVPPGARQSVDNVIYDVTAFGMMGG